MESKTTLQDLSELLASDRHITMREADNFTRLFFDTIYKYVLEDKIVKVKGLGTFKLVEVLDRESVDVNTGERIVIPGHSKVSFTPDSALRDRINKPFADFQTSIIHEGTPMEAMERMDGVFEYDEEGNVRTHYNNVEDNEDTDITVGDEPTISDPDTTNRPADEPKFSEPIAAPRPAERPVPDPHFAPRPVERPAVPQTPVGQSAANIERTVKYVASEHREEPIIRDFETTPEPVEKPNMPKSPATRPPSNLDKTVKYVAPSNHDEPIMDESEIVLDSNEEPTSPGQHFAPHTSDRPSITDPRFAARTSDRPSIADPRFGPRSSERSDVPDPRFAHRTSDRSSASDSRFAPSPTAGPAILDP
ncbi:MAG: HU family DNA-binding protein, partial [Bacteroidaceae bacterium]|nr:HU family DNA-binding protein [Bacteroidaceae bacterium]